MAEQKFFTQNIEAEIPRFEGVWKALPAGELNWRPHERNKSAIELLTSMAFEASIYQAILQEGVVDFEKVEQPKTASTEELWRLFRYGLEAAKNLAAKMTDADWNSTARMVAGGHTHWETTKGWMAWGLLLDLIHHRGQLSVYIRPMGGKVPAIYGPSGDSDTPS